MNERLQLILACIRVGRANVLTTRDIAKMTNLSVRKVRGASRSYGLITQYLSWPAGRFLAGITLRRMTTSTQLGSCSTRSRSELNRSY